MSVEASDEGEYSHPLDLVVMPGDNDPATQSQGARPARRISEAKRRSARKPSNSGSAFNARTLGSRSS